MFSRFIEYVAYKMCVILLSDYNNKRTAKQQRLYKEKIDRYIIQSLTLNKRFNSFKPFKSYSSLIIRYTDNDWGQVWFNMTQ